MHETDLAYLVSETGSQRDAIWLPKSQIEVDLIHGTNKGRFTIPGWLAKEKNIDDDD